MITRSLFRKNFIIFASIALVFVAVTLATTWILTSFERDNMFTGPANMHRALLDTLDEDPLKAIAKLNDIARKAGMHEHDLINDQGVSLVSGKQILPHQPSQEQREKIDSEGLFHLGKNTFPAPPLVLGKTKQPGVYLISSPGPPGEKRPPIGPLVTLAALIVCILISIAVALLYQFSKYHERSLEALNVLSSLREGHLSARLPTKKFDELAPLTEAFNQMASDLEIMVDQLRKADHSRRTLLQDLAHDLRTPLTSLTTFLETLRLSSQKLSEEKKQEVLGLCFSEVEYFGKLVEDLLFLAQITEPKYSLGTEKVDLRAKVAEQIAVFKERYPQKKFTFTAPNENFEVIGSVRLLERLLRNALENSSSFSKNTVLVTLEQQGSELVVSVIDDGPGFSAQGLQDFGHKKASRVLKEDTQGQRISVGIGSVIMKEIAQLHLGALRAENIFDGDKILGAKVSASLKKS